MALSDSEQDLVEDQRDFSGGLNMLSENPADNEYRYAENIVVRTGKPETRPGIRRAFRVNQAGLRQQFSFDNFWFPFSFVSSVFSNIQGSAFFRFLSDTYERQIIVSDGDVWVHDSGFVSQVTTSSTIGAEETVVFIPAYNYLVLLRSGGSPMYWDGSDSGFTAIPAGSPQSIVDASNGEYINGRLWLIKDRDDLYVSDPLSISDFDYVHQLFSIRKGDGDEIVRVYPFHEDYCLVFKMKSVSYLGGVNAAVISGTNLDDYITIANASNDAGLVAKNAIVTSGEQVHFLSYKGITSIERVEQGKLMGVDVPLSAKIQPIIDRINWASVSIACAGTHMNYLLFSFPIDGATRNNCTAVYDAELQTWVSIWTSKVFFPVQYYSSNEKLYALCNDGAMRELFSNDPWDSEDIYDDTPVYDSSEFVRVGEYRLSEIAGVKRIFKSLVENTGTAVSDTSTWEEQTDPQNLYRVESVLWTRYYRHGDAYNPKRPSRCKAVFEHQNPKFSLDIESEDYDTVKRILDNKEYSQTAYDLANVSDWVANNENLDFKTPGRQDYTVFIENNIPDDYGQGSAIYVLSGFTFTGPASALSCDGQYELDSWQSLLNPGGFTKYYPIFVLTTDSNWRIRQTGWTSISTGAHPKWSVENYNTVLSTWFDSFSVTVLSGGQPNNSSIWVPNSPYYHSGTSIRYEDYAYAFDGQGIYLDSSGIDLDVWNIHCFRFIPILQNSTGYSIRLTNTQGKFRLKQIISRALPTRRSVRSK